jgi:AraC-like DNA-binding protein
MLTSSKVRAGRSQAVGNLSSLLGFVQLTGTHWAVLGMDDRTVLDVDPHGRGVMVYLVCSGTVELQEEGRDDPVVLGPGEAAFLLHDRPHRLGAPSARAGMPLDHFAQDRRPDIVPHLRGGPGPEQARVLAGRLRFTKPSDLVPLELLPPSLYLQQSGPYRTMISRSHVEDLEWMITRPGGAAMATSVANVMLMRLLILRMRAEIEQPEPLRVNSLAHVIADIECQPGKPWSVHDLALRAGMSRSSFMAAFAHETGKGPMAYVTDHRLRLAADLLGHTDLRIVDIALQVGYQSHAAFSRAFQRHQGCSPAAFRAGGSPGGGDAS